MFDISQIETKQLPPVDSTEFPPKPVFSVIPDTCLFTPQSATKRGQEPGGQVTDLGQQEAVTFTELR